jgi:hypothetical protein
MKLLTTATTSCLYLVAGIKTGHGRKPTVEEDKKYVMTGSFVSISRL